MSEWVKASERLPTVSKRYLVIHLDENHAWNDDKLGFSTFHPDGQFAHNNVGWWFELPAFPVTDESSASVVRE